MGVEHGLGWDKLAVGGIFFDLEKAFDCLNHDVSMSTLQFYGFTGKAKSWFESYFNNRYQRVQLSDVSTNLSTWKKITDGVPQGSILSPLLFLIYEGNSISKLQIVIEKNRMEIMTYRQHLFFNIISIQI